MYSVEIHLFYHVEMHAPVNELALKPQGREEPDVLDTTR